MNELNELGDRLKQVLARFRLLRRMDLLRIAHTT